MTRLLHLHGCIIDLAQRRIERTDDQLRLTEREAALVRYLAQHAGRDVPRSTLLTEVWGYTAAVNSRTIDTTVRRLRQKIERDPLNPEHLLTAYGVGYRLELRSSVTRPSPPPTVAVGRADGMIGRDEEMTIGLAHLAQNGILTLVGPPGVGKTRLARALAEASGRLVLACTLTDGRLLRSAANALELDPTASDLQDRVDAAFAARSHALLLIDPLTDNLEDHARHIARWHRIIPDLAVVVVSAERLRVTAEHVLSLDGLSVSEGLALLDATGEDPALLRKIVARVDGLPLALELISAQLRLLGAGELLHRIDDRMELLVHGRRDAPRHHISLRSAIESAWAGLSEPLRELLVQSAVFPGSFSLAAAEAVLESPDGRPMTIWLMALLDRALLRRDGDRFVLESNIRLYAANQAIDSALKRRFTDWCLQLADPLRVWRSHDMPERIASLLPERENLIRLANDLLEQSDPVDAALCLHPFLEIHGPAGLHETLLERAIESCPPGPDRARLRVARSDQLRRLQRIPEAETLLSTVIEDQGSGDWVAIALANLGILRLHQGRPELAHSLVDQALEAAHPGSHALAVAQAARGVLALRQGDSKTARSQLLEASEGLRAAGDHAAALTASLNLARALLADGQVDAAIDAIAEAEHDDARLLGRRKGLLKICAGHAELHDRALEDADTHYAAAQEHYRHTGQTRDALLVGLYRAWVLLEQRKTEQALAANQGALTEARRMNYPRLIPLARTQLACARWQDGEPAAAARLFHQAADAYRTLRSSRLELLARAQAAAAEAHSGSIGAARDTLHRIDVPEGDKTARLIVTIAEQHIQMDEAVIAQLSEEQAAATTPTLRLAVCRLLQSVTTKTKQGHLPSH